MEMEKSAQKELDFDYEIMGEKETMKVWMQVDGCKETGNLAIVFYSEQTTECFL